MANDNDKNAVLLSDAPETAAIFEESTDGKELPPDSIAVEAIRTGEQVIAHDGYDVQTYNDAVSDFARLARTSESATHSLATAPALMRDLFWSFNKRVPRIDPPAPLVPSHEINRQIVGQILSTIEWKQVREAGTVDDPLMSAMATIGVTERAINALGEDALTRINTLHELEIEMQRLFGEADALEELSEQSTGDRARLLFEQARRARQNALANQKEIEQISTELEQELEERDSGVRQAAREALAEAETEIDETAEAFKAYSGGFAQQGFGTAAGGHAGHGGAAKQKLTLAQRVRNNEKLKQIAQICGRLTRIALSVQKSKVKHPPDEIASIHIGDDLAHILGSEIALLADPKLEDLFYLKFSEKRLMQYELIHHEPQGKGPILLAIDESGSMAGEKEVWSKAVMLALLSVARMQKRDMVVLHFASQNQLRIDRFEKGIANPTETIDCADHFFSGGTAFEPFMEEVLEAVEDSKYNKADAIIVTDGLTNISDEMQRKWKAIRAAREMRAYGVLIGTDEGAGLLASITDAILTLDNLKDDQSVLETIFAV
jgi:uncharacterized protein with von Willebrand factor type A (vWA) domain